MKSTDTLEIKFLDILDLLWKIIARNKLFSSQKYISKIQVHYVNILALLEIKWLDNLSLLCKNYKL